MQEVKYRLSDGTEVPARLVLKDEDLDLAFLALLKPADKATQAKMAFVPLSDSIAQPGMLDSTIIVSRTGEDLNYIPTLTLGRVVSLVSTPRTCYVSSSGGLGLPVFNHDGKLLGMICRCVRNESSDGSSIRSSGVLSQLILPVADIMRLVPQAKDEVKKLAAADKKAAKTKKKSSEPKKKTEKSDKKPVNAAKKPAAAEKKPADAAKKPAAPPKK